MIDVGISFIMTALVLYTIAVWIEKIQGKLKLWIIFVFGSGFLCDLFGTGIMFYVSKSSFHLHFMFGYLALLIMLLHLFWAIFSYRNKNYEKYFTRFSILAWSIWLVAFVSGILFKFFQ